MPGSSLWLVPPPDSQLYRALQSLINTHVLEIYPEAAQPSFTPHVTLTADTIAPDPQDPQKWLDAITLPAFGDETLTISIGWPVVGNIYFQKLTLAVEKNSQICNLATACRTAGTHDGVEAERWVREQYRPHCSLMYSHMESEAVKAKLDTVRLRIIAVQQFNNIGEDGHADVSRDRSTHGAEIWLVPTERPVSEWKPIAVRQVEDVQWRWRVLQTDSSSS